MSTETRREDNTIKQTESFCSPEKKVTLREASAEPVQYLARLEAESRAAQKQMAVTVDLSSLEYDGVVPQPKPSRHQRRILISLLGNPYTPESEWVKICQLLGHGTRIPHRKPFRRRKLRALALALLVIPFAYLYTSHMEKTFVKSVNPTIAAFNSSWDQYQENMQYEISRSWIPSPYGEGEAISLIFKVNEDGTTGPIRLGKSDRISQDWQTDSFRRSCVRAILNARLNPLPGGLSGQEVECFFHGQDWKPFSADKLGLGSSGEKVVSISGMPPSYADQCAIFVTK